MQKSVSIYTKCCIIKHAWHTCDWRCQRHNGIHQSLIFSVEWQSWDKKPRNELLIHPLSAECCQIFHRKTTVFNKGDNNQNIHWMKGTELCKAWNIYWKCLHLMLIIYRRFQVNYCWSTEVDTTNFDTDQTIKCKVTCTNSHSHFVCSGRTMSWLHVRTVLTNK